MAMNSHDPSQCVVAYRQATCHITAGLRNISGFAFCHAAFAICSKGRCTQVPEALDFGFTPVKHNSQSTVRVENTGDAAVQCRWQIGHPFSSTPETATIDAGQSVAFNVAFCPEEASVYTVLAACHAETGFTATIKVSRAHHNTPIIHVMSSHMSLSLLLLSASLDWLRLIII